MLVAGPRDSFVQAVITTPSLYGTRFRSFSTSAAAPASTAWPLANRAYYVPFYLPASYSLVEMFFQAGTTPGTTNYDLGIYRDDFTLLASLGATAAVSTTDAVLPVGGGAVAASLAAGRYYMAMSSAANTLTARAFVQANGIMRALGVQMQDTAHPLPATATPVSVGTSAFMPSLGVALISNIL